MVSFQTVPISPTRRKTISEFDNSSKKRKWEEPHGVAEVKPLKTKTNKFIFNTELQFETPLPSEWQRCLDIKCGQIYYYNTRTHKRTSKDPRLTTPEPPSPPGRHGHMSLDLELNLPCGSVKNNHITHNFMKNNNNSGDSSSVHRTTSHDHDEFMNNSIISCRNKKNSVGLTRVPSWLAFEGDQKEMVTAVCKKCHMLVMMCKSSPSCPNCKFMHPLDHSPPNLFKQRLGLLCDI